MRYPDHFAPDYTVARSNPTKKRRSLETNEVDRSPDLPVDLSKMRYQEPFTKDVIRSNPAKRRRTHETNDVDRKPELPLDLPKVDFNRVHVSTLRRYKRHFQLKTQPGLSKAELAEIVAQHFPTIPVEEKETVVFFMFLTKTRRSIYDIKSDIKNDIKSTHPKSAGISEIMKL
ncbi:hypothetical protein CAPTEDRAFT_154238 [Capitella teleta]|uniref:Histone deacetylase complex subunit SAP30 Sin3 binding domain-containing protein n=1 Tax=Capitella teleta TaxID=283909 RepID=R7U786_CAPTE|nr:hypothetical protein CAPTEDRAFT_154238 [Capitella teleta]|eukprot:ELU01834.1 hypothetical protein CAPTEDRAFT_154238 [Capitella teleta]